MKLNFFILLLISLSACKESCLIKQNSKSTQTNINNEQIKTKKNTKNSKILDTNLNKADPEESKKEEVDLDTLKPNRVKAKYKVNKLEKLVDDNKYQEDIFDKAKNELKNEKRLADQAVNDATNAKDIDAAIEKLKKIKENFIKKVEKISKESTKYHALKAYNDLASYNGAPIFDRVDDEKLKNILEKFENLPAEQQKQAKIKEAMTVLKTEQEYREKLKNKKNEVLSEFDKLKNLIADYKDPIFDEARNKFKSLFDMDKEYEFINNVIAVKNPDGKNTVFESIDNTFTKFVKAKNLFTHGVLHKIITEQLEEQDFSIEKLKDFFPELDSEHLGILFDYLAHKEQQTVNTKALKNAIAQVISKRKLEFNNKTVTITKNRYYLEDFLKDEKYKNIFDNLRLVTNEFNELHKREIALKQLKIAVNAKDEDGKTILHHVAIDGNGDALNVLIAAGADIDVTDKEGNTALHLAASNANERATKILISNNKNNINKQNNRKETPLHLVISCSKIDYFGIENIVNELIKNGADVNWQDINKNSPLHAAAYYNRENIVKILIGKGADKNIKNDKGEIPFDLTTDPEIKKILK